MKRLLLTLLVLAVCAAPSLAGWHYSPSYRAGYTYYSSCSGYAAGYYQHYNAPTCYPTYYPPHSVSYNPDSQKQLEIIDRAMRVLATMAQAGGTGATGGTAVPAPLRDGPTILGARCAACHDAGVVQAKGSKLALITEAGKIADLTNEQKVKVVKRVYEIDPSKCMPPNRPLPKEEKLALADFLGVPVVEK